MKSSLAVQYIFPALCCAMLALSSPDAVAAFLPIYGGPEYNGFMDTGYQPPGLFSARAVNDSGTAVGFAFKRVEGIAVGTRAVRWDASDSIGIELGILGTSNTGFSDSHAVAINNSGVAIGDTEKYVARESYGERAVRWDPTGTAPIELGVLNTDAIGRTTTLAFMLNDAGTIVGRAAKWVPGTFTYLGFRAVRWDGDGTMPLELGDLGTNSAGYTESEAYDVNDNTVAVGSANKYVSGADMGRRAARWDSAGNVTELGHLGTSPTGVSSAHANDVNNGGTAVGFARKYIAGADKGLRAVRWDASGTAATEMGNLGTNNSGFAESFAHAVNENGIAVGYAEKYQFGLLRGNRAVRWDSAGTVTELVNLGISPDLPTTNSFARAINASGIAVGGAQKPGFGYRAVFWKSDGQAIDLNTLIDPASGWELSDARSISDNGWIAGVGLYDPDGSGSHVAYHRLYLLQIPEPATSIFLVTACAIGVACRRDSSVRRYGRLRF
jgi:hypothetical protein